MADGISDFYRGDTRTYKVRITDKDGNPVCVDGGTLYVTFKVNKADPDTQAALQVTKTAIDDCNNPSGEITIELSASDTGTLDPGGYYYDFQFVDSQGKVSTLLAGKVKVLQDVTLTA